MFNLEVHQLTVEEIEQAGTSFKDDLTRECKRLVRQGKTADAMGAIVAEEYIDKFIYTLKLRAGSQLGRALMPPRARPIRLFRKENADGKTVR